MKLNTTFSSSQKNISKHYMLWVLDIHQAGISQISIGSKSNMHVGHDIIFATEPQYFLKPCLKYIFYLHDMKRAKAVNLSIAYLVTKRYTPVKSIVIHHVPKPMEANTSQKSNHAGNK